MIVNSAPSTSDELVWLLQLLEQQKEGSDDDGTRCRHSEDDGTPRHDERGTNDHQSQIFGDFGGFLPDRPMGAHKTPMAIATNLIPVAYPRKERTMQQSSRGRRQ
jgi:hypothetical protein